MKLTVLYYEGVIQKSHTSSLSKNSGCRFDSECSELKRQPEFKRLTKISEEKKMKWDFSGDCVSYLGMPFLPGTAKGFLRVYVLSIVAILLGLAVAVYSVEWYAFSLAFDSTVIAFGAFIIAIADHIECFKITHT